jgi:MscS family membrane protein
MFNGLFLIMDHAYNYNDTIQLSSGELGNVLEVGFRSTRIKTFDNEILIVPNSEIANLTIKNYAQPNNRIRSEIAFIIEYGNDPQKIKDIILKATKKMIFILPEPQPIVYFEEMNEIGMKFLLYYWVSSYKDKTKSKDNANVVVYDALKNANIKLAHTLESINEKDKNGQSHRKLSAKPIEKPKKKKQPWRDDL